MCMKKSARSGRRMMRFAPPCRSSITCRLAGRTAGLLVESKGFSPAISDRRLALEVAVIQGLAERLVNLLKHRDPLGQRVHLGMTGVAGFGLLGLISGAIRRIARFFPAAHKPQGA